MALPCEYKRVNSVNTAQNRKKVKRDVKSVELKEDHIGFRFEVFETIQSDYTKSLMQSEL